MSDNCGCQNPSSLRVCGTFPEPTVPDQGDCHPYRLKKDCEAPTLPVPACDDTEATIEYDPDATPPFRVLTRLFDSNCEVVTDSEGEPILTYLT